MGLDYKNPFISPYREFQVCRDCTALSAAAAGCLFFPTASSGNTIPTLLLCLKEVAGLHMEPEL